LENQLVKRINRRQFVESAAGVAAFTIVPRHVLGGPGHTPPSEKLNIAGIGVGGQGGGDLRQLEFENIVALCDVDQVRAKGTFERFPNAKKYRDFRVMLDKEDKNIDAVVVATPDHVHAAAAMATMKRGKHVYVEKPLAHSIHEVRQMTDMARKTGVATQMGNHGHAAETMRLLKEWIEDGAIGEITHVDAWTPHAVWPQGIDRPTDTPPVPDTLDWDLWIGPAPMRPYSPAYLPMLWRGWWDFGTGGLGDMGCHIFDPVFYAMDLTHAVSAEASYSQFVPVVTWDKPFNDESYPRASIIHYYFARRNGGEPLKLTWYDGGLMPERPRDLPPERRMGSAYGGVLFHGTKGKIIAGAHGADGLRILPESLMQSYQRPEKRLPRSVGHHKEWAEACKGGPRPGSNFDYAGPMTEAVLLGNVTIRVGQRVEWDPAAMKVTNVPEANQWLRRDYRDGWSL
jgi:predicted dehydrogenase